MVTRTATKNEEPANYAKPSEGTTHLFQIVDCWDIDDPHPKISLDENTVLVKLEVKGGEEEGRTMLHRVSLDDKWDGFFRTQIFLKCIGEPYKGEDSRSCLKTGTDENFTPLSFMPSQKKPERLIRISLILTRIKARRLNSLSLNLNQESH